MEEGEGGDVYGEGVDDVVSGAAAVFEGYLAVVEEDEGVGFYDCVDHIFDLGFGFFFGWVGWEVVCLLGWG